MRTKRSRAGLGLTENVFWGDSTRGGGGGLHGAERSEAGLKRNNLGGGGGGLSTRGEGAATWLIGKRGAKHKGGGVWGAKTPLHAMPNQWEGNTVTPRVLHHNVLYGYLYMFCTSQNITL